MTSTTGPANGISRLIASIDPAITHGESHPENFGTHSGRSAVDGQ